MNAPADVAIDNSRPDTLPTRPVQVTGGKRVAAYAGLVFTAALIVGFIVPVGLKVPEPDTSVASLITILRSNLVLLAVLGACAGLQRIAQQETQQGQSPWVRRITDLVVAVFITLNVAAVGFALGQLKIDALIRILPHAWLEIPAFALGVAGYLIARRGELDVRRGLQIFLCAGALLMLAAPIEAFVTGSI